MGLAGCVERRVTAALEKEESKSWVALERAAALFKSSFLLEWHTYNVCHADSMTDDTKFRTSQTHTVFRWVLHGGVSVVG